MADFANVDHRVDLFGLGRSVAASLQGRDPSLADCAGLNEPWRSVCLKLTDQSPAGRHQTCDEAITDLLTRFFGYIRPDTGKPLPILPDQMVIHGRDFQRWSSPPAIWPAMVRHFIDTYTKGTTVWPLEELLESLTPAMLATPAFGVDSTFLHLETTVWEPLFGGSFSASFSSTDGFGRLLRDIIPLLSRANKLIGFQRLARTAVMYNRFTVMGYVRHAYASEGDPSIQADFIKIIDSEDTNRVIHGAGVIAGRTP